MQTTFYHIDWSGVCSTNTTTCSVAVVNILQEYYVSKRTNSLREEAHAIMIDWVAFLIPSVKSQSHVSARVITMNDRCSDT